MSKKKKHKEPKSPESSQTEVYYKKILGQKYFSVNEIKFLIIITAVGFILRLIYFLETQGTPFFQNLYSDSKIYSDWASGIVSSGNWVGNEVYFMSPLYPYILAVIKFLFGNEVTIIRILQVLVSSLNIWVIYLIARNLISRNAGYAAAVISAFYSVFIFYSGAVLSETLQTFTVSILILLLVNASLAEDKESKEAIGDRWLWIGLLLGMSALFRANILLFFIGAAVWILIHYNKSKKIKEITKTALLYLFLGTAVPVALVTIRNYIVSGDFVLITSNGGINFYLGNNPDAPGVFKTPEGFDFFSDMSGTNYAERITGSDLSPSEASSYWTNKALSYISNNPGDALILNAKKLLLFFDNSENPQSTIMDIEFFANNYSKLLNLPLPGFYSVMLLAIAGIVLTWQHRKKFTLIYIFTILYIISVIIFFVVGRFRVAVTPVFIVFAGAAVGILWELIKTKNYKPALTAAAAVIVFAAIEITAAPKFSYSSYDAYINLGNTAFDNKEYDKALTYYRKSLESENNYLAHVLIGNTLAVKGEFAAAEVSYKRAIEINKDYELTYFNLGLMYVEIDYLEKAINQFQKVIELNPNFSDAYRNLAVALYMKEEYKMALDYFEKYLPMVQSAELKKSVEEDIANIKKLIEEKK